MKRPIVTNILRPFEVHPAAEVFERIAAGPNFLFERIVSFGHATAAGLWFDQPRDEWVVLLSGSARLRFELHDEMVDLEPGDSILIPAHCRHRVEETALGRETVWLALHFRADSDEPITN